MNVGVIGLGVMGRNLARQLRAKGQGVMATDPWAEARGTALGEGLEVVDDMPALLAGLAAPRCLLIMLKAGETVDACIAELRPLLQPGDIVIDGGNSHYRDSERRQAELAGQQVGFLGVGISGGAAGARHGASLMAGGSSADWQAVAPVLRKLAAVVEAEPCCAYMGAGGAGHFVKMVHNGIEYALMQALAEAYAVLGELGGLRPPAMAAHFKAWQEGPLSGYLLRITEEILRTPDTQSGHPLIDCIDDVAGQKGTGGWSLRAGLDYGVAVPAIAEALAWRQLSGQQGARDAARGLTGATLVADIEDLPGSLGAALTGAFLVAFAQGQGLIESAAAEEGWETEMVRVYGVWRGGSILRLELLDDLAAACAEGSNAERPGSLLAAANLQPLLVGCLPGWRRLVAYCAQAGTAVPLLAGSLAYYDGLRAGRLPTNLIQAQRDFFGAHGFRRRGGAADQHHDWPEIL